jgi:RNA polymerase sigma-70 factor (ECF subfamily)
LASNEAEKLPDDPTELARIIADDCTSDDRRNQALGKLAPLIRRLAKAVDRRYGGNLGFEFIEGALGHYWARRKSFDPKKGTFRSWFWRVLRNRRIDFLRKRQRDRVRQASEARLDNEPDPAETSGQAREAAEAALATLAKDRRSLLDRMSWTPESEKTQVDFFAVLLLKLRLATADGISGVLEDGEEPPDEMANLMAENWPWRKTEEGLRFKLSWPTLRKIWASLRADLNRPPYCVSIAALCEMQTKLLDGTLIVTRDLWYQWVKRAKKTAKCKIDPEDWEKFFSVWFAERGG